MVSITAVGVTSKRAQFSLSVLNSEAESTAPTCEKAPVGASCVALTSSGSCGAGGSLAMRLHQKALASWYASDAARPGEPSTPCRDRQ
eukprot:5968280-Pleurochrysis_carterae.AAC.1